MALKVSDDSLVHEGEWKDGRKNGRGKLTEMPSGNVSERKDDFFDGQGTKIGSTPTAGGRVARGATTNSRVATNKYKT